MSMVNHHEEEKPIPKKTYTPFGCLVALHVWKQKRTQGGLVLPDTAEGQIECPTALVIAVGPECKQVKEGDIVLAHPQNPLSKMQHKGQLTFLCREEGLMGVEISANSNETIQEKVAREYKRQRNLGADD
jgi:co-chaperonin GroES (HSP10)